MKKQEMFGKKKKGQNGCMELQERINWTECIRENSCEAPTKEETHGT